VISYLEVLDAQRQLFAAQLDLYASELYQLLDVVLLYRALGGGWNRGSPGDGLARQ
jgi:multidrug efflux system outer membrane protein